MKNYLLASIVALTTLSANAAEYKCYASKFQSDMTHYFADGYVILKTSKKSVNLKYYYVNLMTHETTLEIDATYQLKGLQGGNGSLKDFIYGSLQKNNFPGDTIDTIYFDQSLIAAEDTEKSGVIGKFTFSGHGYSYDWNICYNLKK